MELKQIVVNNGGMSQDLSVSKQENKLAFENQNIRIQATDDGTLLSVTNIKSPNKIKFDGATIQNSTITMKLYGSCVTPEYLILFGSNGETEDNHIDYIYRVTLSTLDNESGVDVKCLYNGNLNFSPSAYIDTLYYEEGEYVKKVYWTDGVNSPRVINIITPGERTEDVEHRTFAPYDSNVFEFYPNAFPYPTNNPQVPTINVEKNRNITSEIPAGVIQYFVSYYWLNGAETLIAAASDTYTVDFSNRGAKADEVGMCAFDISIPADSVNTSFDYIRVYSVIRTTYDGPLSVHIVGDIKIDPALSTGNYTITDNGINQEQLQDSYIYFIGGTPFIAKTLTEKDNTLFLGGVKTEVIDLSSVSIDVDGETRQLEEYITDVCTTTHKNGEEQANVDSAKWWAKNGIIDFKLNKEIPNYPAQFNSFYPYKLQLNGGSSTYKTFKSGEIYRFGIQFQTEQGEWSTVVWIGDKECTERPVYDESTQCFKVNNAEFNMPPEIIADVRAAGFVNYRIVIADPEKHNGRKIKMQGIINPTLFTPGQRALDAPYALPSWIMRPRRGEAAYHHFEPLFSTEVSGSELASYTPKTSRTKVQTLFYPYSITSPLFTVYLRGYNSAQDDPNPYSNDEEDKRDAWQKGHDDKYVRGLTTPDEYVAFVAEDKGLYTTPYIETSGHDGVPEYIVTCFTISPGNQLAVRSVRVWSNDANNNFYDINDNEPTSDNYEVICDYAGSIGGVVYNNYGTILDYVTPKGQSPDGAYTWGSDFAGRYGITEAFKQEGLDLRLIPDANILQQIAQDITNSAVTNTFKNIFLGIMATAAAIIVIIFSAGAAIPAVAGGVTVAASAISLGVGSAGFNLTAGISTAQSLQHLPLYSTDPIISREHLRYLLKENYDKLKDFQKDLISLRYLPLYATTGNGRRTYSRTGVPSAGDNQWWDAFDTVVFSDTKDTYTVGSDNYTTLPEIFKPTAAKNTASSGDLWLESATYIQVFPVSTAKTINSGITKEYNNYYIDESFVTLNSPEAEEGDLTINNESLNFRMIGVAPITSNYADVSLKVNSHHAVVEHGLDYDSLYKLHRATDGFKPLNSEYLYLDSGWDTGVTHDYLNPADPAAYKIHLFSQNNYIGVTEADELVQHRETIPEVTEFPGTNEKQQIINHNFSKATRYFARTNDANYGDIHFGIARDEGLLSLSTDFDLLSYYPSYTNAILEQEMSHHYIISSDGKSGDKKSPGSVSLNFSSTPHLLLDLQNPENVSKRNILPFFKENDTDIASDYYRDTRDAKKYVWDDITPSEVIEITGQNAYDESISLPDTYKQEIIGMLAPKEYHDSKGLWKQGANSEGVASYSVWDKGVTYHSGDYFIAYDASSNVLVLQIAWYGYPGTPYQPLNPTQERNFYRDIRDLLESKLSDPVFLGIITEQLEKSYKATHSTTSGTADYTIPSGGEGDTELFPITIGAYYNNPHVGPCAGKFRINQLQFRAKRTPINEEDGEWKLVYDTQPLSALSSDPDNSRDKNHTINIYSDPSGTLIQMFDFDAEKDQSSDNKVYLNNLDETNSRFRFTLEDYAVEQSSPVLDINENRYGRFGVYEAVDINRYSPYKEYKDFRIKYEAPRISEAEPSDPYLFIGELYQDISHDVLYGGIADHNLRTLSWYPISKTMPIETGSTIEQTEGDTYYQRWDCLKTYPKTEEDINQVVDITSFMVETHKNLDARCDVNRATYSLMSRPTNFNLYNPVYNQPNNIFEYSTDWSNLNSSNTPNMITWSLTKNLFGDVDTWTNITLENNTRTRYPVTKLLNWNNQVLALTEHSMEIVNFNAKNLVPSTDNSFIELQNSNKVDGTTKLQNPYGTHNMSTLITEQGLYFIDDNEKSLIRINGEGPKKIGITKLTDWFHNNVIRGTHVCNYTTPLHLEYDNVHKDIYIKGSEGICLVYNELLDEFTSIITYSGDYWLFNYSGNFYAYRTPHVEIAQDPYEYTGVELHKMFSGTNYNKDFGGVTSLDYSVSYVINPNSYTDKVFTNGILAADLGTVKHSLPNDAKNGRFPFNTVQVWNEYQNTGVVSLQKILDNPSNLKDKFRFWRFIIPRDANSTKWPKDRIRNPWARIKLVGNSNDKMEFHNMTIQYME